jgi:hypothetical protein
MRPPEAPAPLTPLVEDLFRRLPRAGAPEPGTGPWVQGRAGSRREGVELLFHLQFRPDGTVSDVRFQAFGCPHTLATAAWVAGQLPGRHGTDLVPGSPLDWAARLEVPAPKLGRLLRIEDALRAASEDFVAKGVSRAAGAT